MFTLNSDKKKSILLARYGAVCSQIAKCVEFSRNQKMLLRDDPFPLKSWLKVTYPLLKAASFDTFYRL